MVKLRRRDFLHSIVSAAFLFWTYPFSAFAGYRNRPRRAVEADANRCLLQIFSDLEAPRALGRRYLKSYPQESGREQLLETLIDGTAPGDHEALRKRLARRRGQDFRNGNIVIVDGWILARTEAQVCALTTLL